MPTGYTAPVQSGEITTLEDYALTCARGFMPFVLLRDSDRSLEATRKAIKNGAYLEGTEDSYYERSLAKARKELALVQGLSDSQVLAHARREAEQVIAKNHEWAEERRKHRERYQAMIAKVEAWEAPQGHDEFKEFMLSQLRESIEFDCGDLSMPTPEISLSWREKRIAHLTETIERNLESIEQARERNKLRKEWVSALMESLEKEKK